MNRLELIKEIYQLTANKSKREKEQIVKRLLEQKWENSEKMIFDEWNKPENQIDGEKWSQFIRLAIRYDEIKFMFNRILYLVRKYKASAQDYFKVKFQTGDAELPDRISELYLLFTLSDEYFQIYKRIVSRINFDRNNLSSTGMIRGTINWDSTLRNMKTDFPLQFETDDWKKQFATPENVLLVWVTIWLDGKIQGLLNTKFEDPLEYEIIKKLMDISNNCKKIVRHFPFYEVVNSALEHSTFDIRDNRITSLESNARSRLKDGFIENSAYRDFLYWLNKIKSFNFLDIKKKDKTTNFLLEAVRNIDSMYEIWVFFEMLHHFSKYCSTQLVLKQQQHFQFELGYQNLMLFYEKKFEQGDQFAWAQSHHPDFTLLDNDEIIAVFDAKNYGDRAESDDSPITKILAYMTNLGTGYGGIFWPRKQENEYVYPRNTLDSSKYHSNLKVVTYSFDPYGETANIDKLEKKMDKIFSEIKNRMKPSTRCPSCGKIAISNAKIEELFGFRTIGGVVRPQSWCRDCRKMGHMDDSTMNPIP